MSAGIIFPSRPQVAFLAFQFPQVDVVPRPELSWVTWDDAFFGEVVVVQVIDLFPSVMVGHLLFLEVVFGHLSGVAAVERVSPTPVDDDLLVYDGCGWPVA